MFDDLFNLTFTGEKDKTLARKAIDKTGGWQNLRTTVIDSPEGRTIVRNRNGFPVVMHTEHRRAQDVAVVVGWTETDFNLRTYGDPVLTRLDGTMGGFYALVRPITSIDMDGGREGPFKLNPNVKIETNI